MFTNSCLGGTFDHLHAGHKALLFTAFTKASHVYIGLATDTFIRQRDKKFAKLIQPYAVRKAALESYIATQGWSKQAHIIPLSNPFGHSVIEDGDDVLPKILEAIVVSENSKAGAEVVNKKRISQGLKPLEIVSIPMVERGGYEVSSASIRAKLAKPQGIVFDTKDSGKELLGAIAKHMQTNKNAKLIAIGDATTRFALDANLTPQVVVTDGRIGRKPVADLTFENRVLICATNPPGCVTREATRAVAKCLLEKRFVHLFVTGEEDLLVLPFAQQLAPDDTILYGQPQEGIVLCVVNKKLQEQVKRILQLLSL